MNENIKLGPYFLGKTLGLGNFSKVKVAIHEPTGRKVAVKLLNRQKLKSMNMDKKANREIKILRLLNHPNIIRLYEVIQSSTDLFVVMEYIDGGELYDFIVTNKRLSENRARRFFQQIVSGIMYCHDHMVVHRDLKPENLLLDKDMNVKIADFGLSNIMKDGHFLKTSCGSPNYAAPEVISGKLYAGPEVDVWSCGVILYALLCGFLPFDDGNIKELFSKIKTGDYPLPAHASPAARHLVARMLEVDPLKRISLREVAVNEWFVVGLPPDAMKKPPRVVTTDLQSLDEEIAEKVSEMGYDVKRLHEALNMGPDLLTKPPEAENVTLYDELRQMVVAYHLLSDQRRKDDQIEIKEGDDSSSRKSSPEEESDSELTESYELSGNHLNSEEEPNGEDMAVLVPGRVISLSSESSSSAYDNEDNQSGLLATHGRFSADNSKVPRQKYQISKSLSIRDSRYVEDSLQKISPWRIGLQCSASPVLVMRGIFESLRKLGIDWKVVSSYRVKARSVSAGKNTVKMGIQLYQNSETPSPMHVNKTVIKMVKTGANSKWKTSTVDVQLLDGNLFEFVELFEKFRDELSLSNSSLDLWP